MWVATGRRAGGRETAEVHRGRDDTAVRGHTYSDKNSKNSAFTVLESWSAT